MSVIKLGNVFQNFVFQDENGETISSFKINPTDINTAKNFLNISDWFSKRKESISENPGVEEIAALNKDIEGKLNTLFGYDASATLFIPPLTATTVLPDGELFVELILDKVGEVVTKEARKRRAKMDKRAEKYLKDYE